MSQSLGEGTAVDSEMIPAPGAIPEPPATPAPTDDPARLRSSRRGPRLGTGGPIGTMPIREVRDELAPWEGADDDEPAGPDSLTLRVAAPRCAHEPEPVVCSCRAHALLAG